VLYSSIAGLVLFAGVGVEAVVVFLFGPDAWIRDGAIGVLAFVAVIILVSVVGVASVAAVAVDDRHWWTWIILAAVLIGFSAYSIGAAMPGLLACLGLVLRSRRIAGGGAPATQTLEPIRAGVSVAALYCGSAVRRREFALPCARGRAALLRYDEG
jgi:hypothetical protein